MKISLKKLKNKHIVGVYGAQIVMSNNSVNTVNIVKIKFNSAIAVFINLVVMNNLKKYRSKENGNN